MWLAGEHACLCHGSRDRKCINITGTYFKVRRPPYVAYRVSLPMTDKNSLSRKIEVNNPFIDNVNIEDLLKQIKTSFYNYTIFRYKSTIQQNLSDELAEFS
jgi:hypothetical protein